MRYGPLVASAAVVLGLAACKGNDAGMNDELAKELTAAKTSDALALAPHAGVQTVVSAEELTPQGRARTESSSKSSRLAPHRTSHRARVAVAASAASVATAPVPTASAPMAASASTASVAAITPAPAPVEQAPVAPSPHPVDVSYPASDPGTMRGGDGGGGDDGGGGGGIRGIIGAIGGVILRGGVVDGDHCDPRSHRNGGGGILINRRGPILRGTF